MDGSRGSGWGMGHASPAAPSIHPSANSDALLGHQLLTQFLALHFLLLDLEFFRFEFLGRLASHAFKVLYRIGQVGALLRQFRKHARPRCLESLPVLVQAGLLRLELAKGLIPRRVKARTIRVEGAAVGFVALEVRRGSWPSFACATAFAASTAQFAKAWS